MELKDIMELWDRFEASAVDEMELELDGARFSLKKGGQIAAPAVIREVIPAAAAKAPAAPASSSEMNAHLFKEVKAPLVGTFYNAPAPDAAPFVKVGDKVKAGDVIGIIEAMKLMNEVTASEDGVVEKILAQSGELVAYDQVLMLLK